MNNAVSAIVTSGSDVYVGGSFTFLGVPGAVNICRWNGITWSALGGGLNGSVGALAVSGGNLYAGGSFTLATNTGNIAVSANRIAKWNGSAWSALDVGVNNTVSALTFSGNDLYAGGSFTTAGPNPASRLARWNGAAWSTVGQGVNNTVNALATLGTDIIAAGSFSAATNSDFTTVTAARIARWDGSTWSPLSSGFDNPANALAVSGTTLYAGGFFNNAGGVAVGRIAQWNGVTWSVLGSATNNIFVNALAASGTDLYVAGGFSQIGTLPVNNVAKWDGTNWTALGSGLTGTSLPGVNAVAVAGGALYAGGSFVKAGDKAVGFVAKANITGLPFGGKFTNPVYSPGSGFACTFFDATVGQPYRIQSSPSLVGGWTDFTNFTYTAPTVITDASAGASTNKFFRAVTP